jgi:ubiquinone biosynthesis protein UbiJ
MWSILALGAVERIIHHVIDLDAITRIQLNQLQGQLLRVVIDSPQLSVDVFFDENKVRLEPTVTGHSQSLLFLNSVHLILNTKSPMQLQHYMLKMLLS